MRQITGLLVLAVVSAIGCRNSSNVVAGQAVSSSSSSNWLLGNWVLQQPDPPVPGQTRETCYYTRMVFGKSWQQTYAGESTGGAKPVSYVVEGDTVIVSAAQDVRYKRTKENELSWMTPYGLCFYVRA